MSLSRRTLLGSTVALTGAALARPAHADAPEARKRPAAPPTDLRTWAAVRRQFDLDPSFTHLALFFLVSHPRPVRDAVAEHVRRLDANPFETVEHAMFSEPANNLMWRATQAVAGHVNARPEDVALTHNTTTGLALLYGGLPLRAGDEILLTEHDHLSHHESARLAAERAGATVRRVALFDDHTSFDADAMAERLRKAITPKTRVVGITWVHSATGLRLPLERMAQAVAQANRGRDAKDRALLVVDGVHGVGVEPLDLAKVGVDAFAAGLHKWMLAPRGTGFAWARAEVWATMRPLLPTFSAFELYQAWEENRAPKGPPTASWFVPGGFQAYEHWWAVPAAVDFHRRIGPERITQRIHALNQQLNDGLRAMPHVTVHTPKDPALNAGMVCFDVGGLKTQETVARLHRQRILGSGTPYRVSYARLAAGIMNDEADVERALEAVRAMAGGTTTGTKGG